jgi:succinate dehydrogenase flavin-adding protein (antitoxin of CptAB toxin-antitoxin module)
VYVYPKELAESAGILKTLLKPFYRIESRLIEKINSVEEKCLNLYINGATDRLTEIIKSERSEYIKLFAQYDWAYWQFIMKQADSRYKYSSKSFDDIYRETYKDIISVNDEKFAYNWID